MNRKIQPELFVILTQQRSGSIWFSSMLDVHPDLKVYPELFQHSKRNIPNFYDGKSDIEKFLQEIIGSNDEGSVGFKLMYDQYQTYPSLIKLLYKKSTKIIQLHRKNILDVFISKQVAIKNEVWSVGKGTPALKKVRLNTNNLIENLEHINAIQDSIRQLARKFTSMEMFYEDLVENPMSTNSVFEFLGVKELHEIDSGRTKKIIKSRAEVVTNWNEVSRCLENSRFKHFL